MDLYTTVFVNPWPFWAGGLAIGTTIAGFAWVTGKSVGVSGGFASGCGMCSQLSFFQQPRYQERWRVLFILGIPLGALLATVLAQRPGLTMAMGSFDSDVSTSPGVKVALLLIGGALLGYGSRWAGGCTSGHAMVGIANGAKSSLLVTAGFMVGGFVALNAVFLTAGLLA